MDILPGSKQQEAESWTSLCDLTTQVDSLGKHPNDGMCSSGISCFDDLFSSGSIADGNAEHFWVTQDPPHLDARSVPQPQHLVLPELHVNGDYASHGFNAAQCTDTDEAAYCFTSKRLAPPEMVDTISSDPGLVDTLNFPTLLGGVVAAEDPTRNYQDCPHALGDSNHSRVNENLFLERTLGLPSESAENGTPDFFFSELANNPEPGSLQDNIELCRRLFGWMGPGASAMQAPENELPSIPMSEHIPRSAGCSQVNTFHIPDLDTRHSYIGQSTFDWNPTDIDAGSLFLLEASQSHPMLYNSAESIPNTLLSEKPMQYRAFPAANNTADGATTGRDGRKRHQEKTKSHAGLSKPQLRDFLLEFDLDSKAGPRKRMRKTFSAEQRKKVNAVRKTHACVSCQARKISCSMSGVCEHCLRAASDPLLAKQICLRNKLKDTFIGVKDIYGRLDARRGDLEPILGSMIGSPVRVLLSVICSSQDGERVAELPVEVRGCSVSPKGRWKSLGKAKGIYFTCDSVYDQRYVVVPSSLPSLEEVDQFGRRILSLSSGSLSGEITRRLDDFLLLYCGQGHPSPLRRFSNSTLRVIGLNGLVSYGALNFRDGSYKLLERSLVEDTEDRNFISPTVNDQIRLLAAEGLKPTEDFLFAEIDKASRIVGSSKHARIVVGICLMRLLLLYRDRVIRDEIRLSLPRQKLIHRTRLEQSAFMYKRLTIAYGTLCRECDSPLTSVYESEPAVEAGEHDIQLRASFLRLRPAYHEFCENLTEKHDDVFKGLISHRIDNASISAKKRKLSRKNN